MTLPDFETIERAYKGVTDVVASLPETTEQARAWHHLGIAQKYTYEARERAQPEQTEAVYQEVPDD